MATTTRVLDANVNGTVYTSNANDALEALDTCHSGATAPTDEVANGKLWLDTSTTPGVLKIYNNATWVAVVNSTTVDDAGGLLAANSLSDVASAATALSNLGLSATATEINVLDGITASTTELNYVDGVTSDIQTQIDNIPQPPELTQVQVEDDTSTVFGQVSGQRLGQSIAALVSVSTTGGDVGTYLFGRRTFSADPQAQFVFGDTYAGSTLYPAGLSSGSANTTGTMSGSTLAIGDTAASALSGTWRAMGQTSSSISYDEGLVTLFVRIA